MRTPIVLQKKKLVRAASALLLCLLWLLLVWLAFRAAGAVSALYPALSLRYGQPISPMAAEGARRYAVKNQEETPFWPTFWDEASLEAKAGATAASADTIRFYGDPNMAFPASYLAGNAPGELDTGGCAVSRGLAHRLWGSEDVLGKAVQLGEKEYLVRGVFAGDSLSALVNTGLLSNEGWRNVELAGRPETDPRAAAENFAAASGLGQPDNLVDGDMVAAVASMAAMLPAVLAIGAALVALLRKRQPAVEPAGGLTTRRISPAALRQWLLFAALLVFALLLPQLLGMLPGWLIPTRWSDFAFWGGQLEQLGGYLRQWLLLQPFGRDADVKALLMQLAAYAFAAVFLLPLLWRRLAGKGETSFETDPERPEVIEIEGRDVPKTAVQGI